MSLSTFLGKGEDQWCDQKGCDPCQDEKWNVNLDEIAELVAARGDDERHGRCRDQSGVSCGFSDQNPQAWLTNVLGRIADHKITRLDEPLPWSYAATEA